MTSSRSISIVLAKFVNVVPDYTAPQGNPKGLHYCSPEVKKTSNCIASKKVS